MDNRIHPLRTITALSLCAVALTAAAATYPSWWTDREVVINGAQPADYSPANLGQLKWFATNACDELEQHVPGGAGPEIWELVRGFSKTGNNVPVNLGQLKRVVAPFYDRLRAKGYPDDYPWTETTADDANYAAANIGQLKNCFSFDLTTMQGYTEDVEFGGASSRSGFYTNVFAVTLSSSTPGATVYYTLDGSEPTPHHGTAYGEPLQVSGTKIVRAVAHAPGKWVSAIAARTYVFTGQVPNQSIPSGATPEWDAGDSTVPADFAMDHTVANEAALNRSFGSIPSLSLLMDPADLFGEAGIYDADTSQGNEREVAGELMYPGGREGVAFHCAVEPHSRFYEGGSEGGPKVNRKRSLRLAFKSEYGDSKLRFPVLESAPCNSAGAARKFDRLVLRAGSNMSYAGVARGSAEWTVYARDQWGRDTQTAMSGVGVHGTYVHLFLNGLYWGLYNLSERPDAWFGSTYFDGEKEDWYAHNHNGPVGDYAEFPSSGERWEALMDMCDNDPLDFTVPANYVQAQEYLDMPTFCDYVLTWWACGGGDWDEVSAIYCNNFFALNRNESTTPIRYFCWDMELAWYNSTITGEGGRVHPAFLSPGTTEHGRVVAGVFRALWHNEEFRMLFADRLYAHVRDGGALTDAACQRRWRELCNFIEEAVVAESARWGDAGGREETLTRGAHWYEARNYVLGLMDGNVASLLISCRRNTVHGYPLYPIIDPPTLEFTEVNGGAEYTVTLTCDAGQIHYWIDGGDPRFGGETAASGTTLGNYDTEKTFRARVLSEGVWSALAEQTLRPPSAGENWKNVHISELMFNPPALTGDGYGAQEYEYLELFNSGSESVDISQWQVAGIGNYEIPQGTLIEGGQYLVIARNPDAFVERYGFTPGVPGYAPSNLDNGGEPVTLKRKVGAGLSDVVSLTYDDDEGNGWPKADTDGGGYSLVLIDSVTYRPVIEDDSDNWRASAWRLGSPGAADIFSRGGTDSPPAIGLPGTQVVVMVSAAVEHVIQASVACVNEAAVQWTWEHVSGGTPEGVVISDPTQRDCHMTFHEPATYVFSLLADDGQTASAATVVAVVPAPADDSCWLRSDIGVTASGGEVYEWQNGSGTFSAVPPDAGKRPLLSSQAAFRSREALIFDGLDDVLVIGSTLNAANRMIAVAFRTGADVTSRQVVYEEGDASAGRNIYIEEGTLYLKAWTAGEAPAPLEVEVAPRMQYTVQFVTQTDGIGSRVNGRTVGSVAISPTSATGGAGIGGISGTACFGTGCVDSSDPSPFGGLIFEVLRLEGEDDGGGGFAPLSASALNATTLYQAALLGVASVAQAGSVVLGNSTTGAGGSGGPQTEALSDTLALTLTGYHAFGFDMVNGKRHSADPAIVDAAGNTAEPSPLAELVAESIPTDSARSWYRWIQFSHPNKIKIRPPLGAWWSVPALGFRVPHDTPPCSDNPHGYDYVLQVKRDLANWPDDDDTEVTATLTLRDFTGNTFVLESEDGPVCEATCRLTIIKVDSVDIYKPETDTDAEWQNAANVMDWKEVIESDEDLKFKIKFTPAIDSKDQFPCDIEADAFVDEAPSWVTIPINGDDKLSPDKKELWMTVLNSELKSYGFIPSVEEDSEWEHCSFESTGSGNFNDSDQFDTDIAGGLRKPRVNARGPGNWTDTDITWSGKTVPAWSADGDDDSEYLKAGGGVYVEVRAGGESDRGLLQDQADWLYISGHGSHSAGTICGVAPADVDWNKDLRWVFMAGCSACDIDDLNGNYGDGQSPGEDWAVTGPDYFLGYNWYAPADTHAGDPMFTAKIVEKYFQHRVYYTYWESWKRANADMAGGWSDSPYNACFIRVSDSTYFYFDRGLYIPMWTSYNY